MHKSSMVSWDERGDEDITVPCYGFMSMRR